MVILAVATVVVITGGALAWYFLRYKKYNYHFEMFSHTIPCSNIFVPSARKGFDTLLVSGRIRKSDQIYTYIYNHNFYITVWRIEGLRRIDLDTVRINQNVHLDNVDLQGETPDAVSSFDTQVRFGPFFDEKLVIDLDEYSYVSDTFKGPHYRGFYGTLSRIAFEDGRGQIVAMEDYKRRVMPTLFVMYKAHDSFYFIFINSDKPFGMGMMKILNLK